MKLLPRLTALATAALLLGLASSPLLARSSSKASQSSAYPDASRKEPKLDLTSERDSKDLKASFDTLNAGDMAKAEQQLQTLLDHSKSKYVKDKALQGLSLIKYKAGDFKASAALLQRALADGTLPNDDYFGMQYMLAVVQQAGGEYQASLDTLAKWRADGKKETAESYATQGNDEYQLGKYAEAIASVKKAQSLTDKPEPQWNQILLASYSASGQDDKVVQLAQEDLAAHPDDPVRLSNAVDALQNAGKYPEAIKLMESARANGKLTTAAEYNLLGALYFNQSLEANDPKVDADKAIGVVKEGLSKGILQASAETYLLLGKAQFQAGDNKSAMDSFNKALPLAKDGEPALQIASILLADSKFSQAKSMVEQAISKGVTKQPGRAYMVLAACEAGLKHKAARIAALKEAAKDPKYAHDANEQLKKLGAGK